MRIALCVRFDKRLFRLVWINESKNGIYVDILGGKQEAHVSYHQDGNRHVKLGNDYHNRFSDTPIAAHKGPKQLGHLSLPLNKESFKPKMPTRAMRRQNRCCCSMSGCSGIRTRWRSIYGCLIAHRSLKCSIWSRACSPPILVFKCSPSWYVRLIIFRITKSLLPCDQREFARSTMQCSCNRTGRPNNRWSQPLAVVITRFNFATVP